MHTPTSRPAAGLARLREMAADGSLDELADRNGLAVLTVFGSAAHGDESARPRP